MYGVYVFIIYTKIAFLFDRVIESMCLLGVHSYISMRKS